jgi:hypothetical protein
MALSILLQCVHVAGSHPSCVRDAAILGKTLSMLSYAHPFTDERGHL